MSREKSVVIREGNVLFNDEVYHLPKVTLDTGASSGNYIGKAVIEQFDDAVIQPCSHRVRLGDGKTSLEVTEECVVSIQLYDDGGKLCEPIQTRFYVVNTLGDEAIVGLPDLLGNYFSYFVRVLTEAVESKKNDSISTGSLLAIDKVNELVLDYVVPETGKILNPWSQQAETCPEEEETPDPLSFNEDILHFMEMSVEESRNEYFALLPSHISEEMKQQCPEIFELLQSEDAQEIFAPSTWEGMKVPEAVLVIVGTLPARLSPKARPIRPELYEQAKTEFTRLLKYFYVPSDSPIASALVIASKATAPFIRLCGDYRPVNIFISIPQDFIPIVQYELIKAAQFKVYVDLDMANSFHQIPLSEEFSKLLSVKTPWGLFRPKFLPEGVGPASGLLQNIVRDIFSDFLEWTIVIFDNFLVLANDYRDAYEKLKKILCRCREKGIVLKLKKSWIGVTKVTFFGYEVTYGRWKLSDSRKEAIAAIPFPTSTKEMQRFLGAALFFHHHVANYSEWSAKLYEMIHTNFNWEPTTWSYDYVGHFEKFKQAIQNAAELYFPDYSLQWILRCDASEYAVGAVLYQEKHTEDGDIIHQPIAFASKRFSKPAQKWDTYKREAYALYYAVVAFGYYLKLKPFIVQTDHRNLQFIEMSQSPIVVRWRALLQSYPFVIQHIPGNENKVADYLSRIGTKDQDAVLRVIEDDELSFEAIMQSVHGGRSLHFGAAETWRRAKEQYPTAHIAIEAVRNYVKECPLCQKMRDTGIRGLKEQTLSLKPLQYRRVVGIDHVTVTPADIHGNTCVVLIVEQFSHFPQAYPRKEYTAEGAATSLFKHLCTFGLFDLLTSDPSSAFMSEVIDHLNKWLGVSHKVSLVGRHESNGCEGSGKQFLRHLKTLVFDERLVNKWSDDTVLPLINFQLCSFPTSETGGYTPFQLKYGTEDASYFRLPESLEPGNSMNDFITKLDENLKITREISLQLQQKIVEERKASDGPAVSYECGDLVLWNPREKPSDYLHAKLSPNWLGPYEVVKQNKNDVTCIHIVSKKQFVLHVGRLKPFIGSYEDALRVAKLDQNQFHIISFNYYTGNPHMRQSMTFNVTFEDEILNMPYNSDLADSVQFDEYVNSIPALFPLRCSAVESKKAISAMNKLAIVDVSPRDKKYLNLRFFDGTDRSWFDSLNLPEVSKTYVVPISFVKWNNKNHRAIQAFCRVFNCNIVLTFYDVFAYVISDVIVESMVVVDEGMRTLYPQMFE